LICRDSAADVRSHHFHVTAAKKRGVYQFEVQNIMAPQKGAKDVEDDRLRDVVDMARDGGVVCLAQRAIGGPTGMYNMVNLRTAEITSLFPFEERTMPLVKYVSHNEVSPSHKCRIVHCGAVQCAHMVTRNNASARVGYVYSCAPPT
jgi:hypothetical protein